VHWRYPLLLPTILFCLTASTFCHPHHHGHDLAVEYREGGQARVFCRRCGTEITVRSDHVKAIKAGADKYVAVADPAGGSNPILRNLSNPSGVDFEVALFSSANNTKLHSTPSYENSFFPPYSWQILSCSKCQAHLGWKFQSRGGGALAEEKDTEPAGMVCDGEIVPVPSRGPADPLKALEGKCTVSKKGWWTYQWCHRKEIRQYHSEADGKRSSDWSLGRFDTKDQKQSTVKSQFEPHFFLNGQKCDENGKRRWSEVHFSCCANDESRVGKQAEEEGEEAYIRSIEEPGLCHYKLQVCSKQLCPKPPKRKCNGVMRPARKSSSNSSTPQLKSVKSFYGLIWPNLVAEDADELYWVRGMRLRTSLAQTGQM